MPRPYVSVRVKDQMFHLHEGHEVEIDPYYVFVAGSTKKRFEGDPSPVYSAGCLAELGKELISDAAHVLTTPRVRVL